MSAPTPDPGGGPSRWRQVQLALLGLLVAPVGPALVAWLPLAAPLGPAPVAIAGAVTAVALCAAAHRLTRAIPGVDRASAAVLLVVVYAAPVLLGAMFVLEAAWSLGAQAALDRSWSSARGDGSLEALERAVAAERPVLAALALNRIGVRPRVQGHEALLDERRAYDGARVAEDPHAWKEHGARATAALGLARHGHDEAELDLVRDRDAEVRARLLALRVTGANRLLARAGQSIAGPPGRGEPGPDAPGSTPVTPSSTEASGSTPAGSATPGPDASGSGGPAVDLDGVRFLAAVVRGASFDEHYRESRAADRLTLILGDRLGADGPRAERARARAAQELARLGAACLRQPAFFVRGRTPPGADVDEPSALQLDLALAPGPGALESSALAPDARALDLELRVTAHGGFWGTPEWRMTARLHVEAAPGEDLVEAAWLAAARRVAVAMGLDPTASPR